MIINFFNKLYDIVNKLFLSRLLVTFLAITLLTVLLFSGASIQQHHNVYAEKVASHYQNAAGNVLDQLTLTYSEQGNINHIQENAQENPQQVDLFYDEGQRLIGLKRNNQLAESYSYDQAGNRLSSKTHNNWTYNDYNQLTQYGSTTLTYNHNANQINDGSNTYHYNASNRLSEVKQDANTIATYRYDDFGRRISKTANNQTSYFLYDDTGLLAEYNAQGNLISEFAYHPDSPFMSNPLLTRHNNQLYFSHNDQTLASRTLYSQAGAEVWEIQNNGFTRDVTGNPTVSNNLRFPGQYFDEETGTYYNYHRNYNPHTGRYIQSDPIGLEGGVNTYTYVYSSPGNYVDPYGEFALPGCLVGMAMGAAARGMDGCDIRVEDLLTGCVAGALLGGVGGSLAKAAQASRAAKNAENARKAVENVKQNTKRTKKVEPIKDASGPHTTWKSDPHSGEITRHETWAPNPRNPSGWDKVQSTDLKGAPHINKQTGEAVPTPHTQGKNIPGGVRPAKSSEIPKGKHYNY